VRTDPPFQDVETWVSAFVDSIPTKPRQPYDAPEPCEQDGFRLAAVHASAGDLRNAAKYLNPMGYDVFDFTDRTGRVAVFAEQKSEGKPYEHGWGLYFVGIGSRKAPSLLVEAPHPIFDTDSEHLAAHAFDIAGALYLGIAGTHRYVNGFDGDADGCMTDTKCADMSHQPKSIFEAMHGISLLLALPGRARVYQSHGYGAENHESLNGAQAVSAGLREPTDRSKKVAQALRAARGPGGGPAFGVCLVGEPSGQDCTDLRALENVQARSTNGDFIHVEASRPVRADQNLRNLLAEAVVDAMRD